MALCGTRLQNRLRGSFLFLFVMSDRLFALNFLFLSSIFAAIELFLAVMGVWTQGLCFWF